MPAQFGAACIHALDTRHHRLGEARRDRLHGRYINPDPAHADPIHFGEDLVRGILADIDNSAAASDSDFPHRIQHARVVAAVRARLHENETLDAKQPGQFEILGKWSERRRVAERFGRS